MGFVGPDGVEGDGCGEGLRSSGGDTSEEGAGVSGDLILLQGDTELTLVQFVVICIKSGDGELDGTFLFVEEGVEVVVGLSVTLMYLELHVLLAVHTTESCGGIEGTRTSCVIKLHLCDIFWDGIGNDEAAECHDAAQGEGKRLGFVRNGDRCMIEEGVGITCCVGELNLGRVGHRGITIAAVSQYHELVGALFELEAGSTKIALINFLILLFQSVALHIVDGEVESGAGFGSCSTGEGREGGLFQLVDGDGEVAIRLRGCLFGKGEFLAGREQKDPYN